ncbi:MAG: lytic transglycosylase domain-containing protein [Acidobacteriota bacterium]|nr:lytic transglycosylase domain-containing protein [Acidobacteriota bacterium]
MIRKRGRAPLLALATMLSLVLSLSPTSSYTSVPAPRKPPSPYDRSPLSPALASWMRAETQADTHTRGIVSASDLRAALASQPRHFGIRVSDGGIEAQRRLLSRLPYGSVMARTAERNRVDGLLLAAVVEAESQFIPDAVSPGGAIGLMQLLPSTGEEYGAQDLLDPKVNLDAGSRYLGRLLARFQGDKALALAAYNCGPEVVSRYGHVPPFRETQGFVKKVMDLYDGHHQNLDHASLDMQRDPFRPRRSSAP